MSGTSWGAHELTVRFGRRTTLENVSLEVPAGAVTAVYGGDGAGKTTLLRAMAGGVRPAAGHIRRPERERIGYVAGTSGLYADLSVDENIAFVGSAYGLRDAAFKTRTQALLERVGLEGTGERLAGRLSGGMRQKLALALAMLHDPDLLILDEPTTGLDPVSRAELWRLIAGAAAGGAGVLVSTSSADEAERAAGVLVLEGGRAVVPAAREGAPPATLAAAQPGPPQAAAPAADNGPPLGGPAPATERRSAIGHGPPAEAGRPAPLAAASGVTRRFGRFTAVDAVDLDVGAGEVVGLLGANGAGKTTLIRMLLGLLRPSEGRVELFGRPPSRATRRRLGYVPQGLGLWEDLTVAENLAFVARSFPAGAPPDSDAELAGLAGTVVRDLPLGLRRRLAFAAALSHAPELLVLDEPTSGVGASARLHLWATIHEAARAGAGVLVTTHHMEEANECDRLVVMAAGRVVAEGSMEAIIAGRTAVAVEAQAWEAAFAALEDEGLAAALVGRTLRVPDAAPDAVRAALEAHGVQAALRVVPATLEEAFVTLARGEPGRTGPASSTSEAADAVS